LGYEYIFFDGFSLYILVEYAFLCSNIFGVEKTIVFGYIAIIYLLSKE